MRKENFLYAFNRGIVSDFALGRIDQSQVLSLSSSTMTNMLPRILGPMVFRPGTKYLGATASNAAARYIPFIFSPSDVALVEITNLLIRVWSSDALISRATVTTAVTNGSFTGNITGWTDGSDSGGTAAYEATNHLKLTSNGTARAIAYQQVTTVETSTEHALTVVIATGPVTFRVGSTLGGDEYVTETTLDTGTHSLPFTPTGNFYVQFASTSIQKKLVDSCTVEAAGTMTVAAPWAAADLGKIRYDQSGDVLYIACDGYAPRKIERRGTRPNAKGWSVCNYNHEDGPFFAENTGPITIASSATTGNVTLTASTPLFRSTHVGALFSITTLGQSATATISAENTWASNIFVTGLSRAFGITITGDLSAGSTVVLQSSTDESTWSDVSGQSWTNTSLPVSTSYDDTLLNQQIYYRLGIKTGAYVAADSVTCTLTYNAGSQKGYVRVTAFTNATTASAEVLTELGGTAASKLWQEGLWSSYRGFPTSVKLHEGRLWWFGRDRIVGSVSDDYTSFDEDVLGSSGPINRTLGSGPVDVINWALSLDNLALGAGGREVVIRSSAYETPLSPIDFTTKTAGTQGSATVMAQPLDKAGIFVHQNGVKVFQLKVAETGTKQDPPSDLMALCPEIANVGIVRMAIQRQPDTRIHCVLSDGSVVLGVYSELENILGWFDVSIGQDSSSASTVEDVVILPAAANTTEDQVYYVVKRTINSATVRYLEKWAREDECRLGATSKNMDSHVVFTNSPASTTVSGLSHLNGESVVVWADSAAVVDSNDAPQTYTVSAGAITLGTAATTGVVGLAYTGQWKSTKLGTQFGSKASRITGIKFILAYLSRKGFKFGNDFTNLDVLPKVELGTTAATTYTNYDYGSVPFPTTWNEDTRLCIQIVSPHSGTVIATDFEIEG